MKPIVPPPVDRYAEEHDDLRRATPGRGLPRRRTPPRTTRRCATGAVEGRFLELLVFATRARGSSRSGRLTGYSALAMAGALPPDGTLVTCELDPELAEVARRHFEASPHGDRIELRVGPALETLRELTGPFDLVFVDADKENYVNYYEAALPLLAERGLLVVDNTLWSGDVVDEGERCVRAGDSRVQRARARGFAGRLRGADDPRRGHGHPASLSDGYRHGGP